MQNAMHVERFCTWDYNLVFGWHSHGQRRTSRCWWLWEVIFYHIQDVRWILGRLQEVHLTLSSSKSHFGIFDIVVVGHLCSAFGRRQNMEKLNVIAKKLYSNNIIEVWSFLGGYIFYRLFVTHYAHVVDPIYAFLRKSKNLTWQEEHRKVMRMLREMLMYPFVLRIIDYQHVRPVIFTILDR